MTKNLTLSINSKINKEILDQVIDTWYNHIRKSHTLPNISNTQIKFEYVCEDIFTQNKFKINLICDKGVKGGFIYEDGKFGWVLFYPDNTVDKNENTEEITELNRLLIVMSEIQHFAVKLESYLNSVRIKEQYFSKDHTTCPIGTEDFENLLNDMLSSKEKEFDDKIELRFYREGDKYKIWCTNKPDYFIILSNNICGYITYNVFMRSEILEESPGDINTEHCIDMALYYLLKKIQIHIA